MKLIFMKKIRFIKYKIKLIYASPLIYLMMLLQVSFLVICMYFDPATGASDYFNILKKDLFLWMICIPIMVVQHKVSIFSTYYSCISRVCSKRRMILVDYLTMAVSTCISACIVIFTPLIFLWIKEKRLAGQEMLATLFFLLARYVLLGLLIQYIIYTVMYTFPNLQKRGGSICVLPFLFYFIFTSPMEVLRIKGQYIPILDFSAGGYYVFDMDGIVLWGSIFYYNIHLIGYLVLYVWITIKYFSKRWEFLEDESIDTL